MTKKLKMSLLGMSSVAVMAAPVALAVSCGSEEAVWTDTPGTMPTGITQVNTKLVTDGGIISDKSFNQQGADALKEIKGIAADSALPISEYLEPKAHEAQAIATSYASMESKGAKLILAPGFYHTSAITNYFEDHADSKLGFILLDDDYNKSWNFSKPGQNYNQVASIQFKTEQAAFLAGVFAANYIVATDTTTGHKVGMFGGGNFPSVTDFMKGFTEGVKYYNEHGSNGQPVSEADKVGFAGLSTPESYTNSGFAQGGGTTNANALLTAGADVILPVAGPQTADVIAAITQKGDAVKNHVKIIGVDTDQSLSYPDSSPMFLTSIQKNIHKAFVDVYKKITNTGTVPATIKGFGELTLGDLDNGLLQLAPTTAPTVDTHNPVDLYNMVTDTENSELARTLKAEAMKTEGHFADWNAALAYIQAND